MLTPAAVAKALDDLSLLKFAPKDTSQLALIRLLSNLCADDESLSQLVRDILQRYDEWPGPRALRALCGEPADGLSPYTESGEVYPQYTQFGADGVDEPLQLREPIDPEAARELQRDVDKLAAKISMERAIDRERERQTLAQAEAEVQMGPRKTAEQLASEVRDLEVRLRRA